MAKTLGPLMSEQATGMIGGMCFVRSGSSTRVGSAPGYHWPLTSKTATVRAKFQAVSRSWSALSDADRASWTINAPGPVLGFSLFLGCNMRLLSLGMVAIQTLPSISDRYAPCVITSAVAVIFREFGVCAVFWDKPGSEWYRIRLFLAESTLGRTVIDKRKFVQRGLSQGDSNSLQCDINPAIPTFLGRLDLIDTSSGLVLDAISLGVIPDYNASMGVVLSRPLPITSR